MHRLPHPASALRLATRIAGCAALLGALVLWGCDGPRAPGDVESPAAPLAPGAGLEGASPQATFYPLEIGNRWHFDRNSVLEFFPPGSTDPTGTDEFHAEVEHVLDQTEELFGRTYVVESWTIVQDFPLPDVVHNWVRYRQDQSGLYEADVALNDPPGSAKATVAADGAREPEVWTAADLNAFGAAAAAHPESFRRALVEIERRRLQLRGALRGERVAAPPGGVLSDEITRLRYPLHPGEVFPIRVGLLDAHVEALEQLVTPAGTFPAWRFRLVWGFPDFEDTILTWYSRCGYLKLYFQGETTVTAPDGTVLGTMKFEEVEVLDDLDVQGRPCGNRPGRPVLDD